MDPSVRRLAGILRRLSAVYPSERTETAAAEFLALDDPGKALGRALRFLVWQRTMAVALGHLEAAGADLDAILVPAGRVSGVFPRTQVWTVSIPARSVPGACSTWRRVTKSCWPNRWRR